MLERWESQEKHFDKVRHKKVKLVITSVLIIFSLMCFLLTFASKKGVIFFLIFAALILMNFINSSIQFRKKEIGTLRAIGCRSIDIIKMFLYESLILMLITLVISFAIIHRLISAVNNFVENNLFVNMEVLKFGVTQIIQITAIMLVIVILANVIPVKKITKMKPIDAILNK